MWFTDNIIMADIILQLVLPIAINIFAGRLYIDSTSKILSELSAFCRTKYFDNQTTNKQFRNTFL